MRFFKLKNRLNWKYALGEILLIFIGINLAIWFNNWDEARRMNHAKEVALERIAGEIRNNQEELDLVTGNTQQVSEAFRSYEDRYRKNSSEVEASSEEMRKLQKQYPGFFRLKDSILLEEDRYLYQGTTFIQLELVELAQIAWETTKSVNVLNEFEFECLYDLESMYNLQNRTQKEIDRSGEALQRSDLQSLKKILEFLYQLEQQLDKAYAQMLDQLDDCR